MLLLLNWSSFSQGITINDKQAREIIKDKRELIHSRVVIRQQGLYIVGLERLRDTLTAQVATSLLSEQLGRDNYKSALERIKILEKKTPLIYQLLKGLGVFLVGVLVGVI